MMKTTISKIPKTKPYSEGEAPFFSACEEEIFTLMNIYIYIHICYIRINLLTKYWQFKDTASSYAVALSIISCRIAINIRRDNIPINFVALLHAARLQIELSYVWPPAIDKNVLGHVFCP